ncbi:ATP-dependent RNA helicase [Martiniozyma asiatica (nom. inval.)]|nr:ATP-dependent RNA helicase [Martiniozyma asiatica]
MAKKARNYQKRTDPEGSKKEIENINSTDTNINNEQVKRNDPINDKDHTMHIIEKEKSKKKRKLKEQLLEEQKEKVKKQKKKRLDKYIEHQLRREEKELLFKKLQETRIDTSIFKSAKLIGTGTKKTKREKLQEALEKERSGRGDEETSNLLYESREIKPSYLDEDDEEIENEDRAINSKSESDKDSGSDSDSESQAEDETFQETGASSGGFIDYRPLQTSTSGGLFGFSNLQEAPKKRKVKNYTWREKIELQEKKKNEDEDEMDFQSDDESDASLEDENTSDEEIQEEENDNEQLSDTGSIDEDENDNDSDEDEDQEESSEEESSEEESDVEVNIKKEHTKKALDFKQWAEEQVRKMEGREAAPNLLEMKVDLPDYKPLVREEDLEDGLKEDFVPINANLKRKITTVNVQRNSEIQQVRQQLPVYAEEHRIMEAIHHNDCVIICGETGSGKTTQVPQFLFESGFGVEGSETPGLIGVTQPRRVAAVSMAKRVSSELGNYSDKVGYQIRFDATVNDDTALKFMTDGVLLREMMNDFLLMKYSALIIDEAHERNVNTDILIGMLSRVLKLRREYADKEPQKYYPLKLIIMSATLRVSDFSENSVLFDNPPPILKVDARQYPVSTHFNKRTAFNYTEEAFRKTCKIHKRLPKGAILIFMTGKAEIIEMVKKLRNEFPMNKKDKNKRIEEIEEELVDIQVDPKNADVEAEEIDFDVKQLEINEENDDYNSSDEDEEGFDENLDEDQTENDPLYVLPLYSLLPTSEQMKIFEEPPAGARLCVVATNVAETSLTIPNVRYVVDCGRAKERKYNEETGVQSFEIDWVAKASADQRAGRAGRTGPGHCYRLYSSAIYESEFPQFSQPEILRMPVEGVVLNMKSMGIQTVSNFPFPTPPDRKSLQKAEKLLTFLGALNKDQTTVTDIGKKMSLFPLSPRFSKMLLIANQQECLPYVIALVSGLSVGDPFLTEFDVGIQINEVKEEEENQETQQQLEARRKLRTKYNKSKALFTKLDKLSDCLKLLSAICASDHIPSSKKSKFYKDHFLREKQMNEITKLRKQLSYIVAVNTTKDSIASSKRKITDEEMKLGKPSKTQIQAIKQMVAVGFIDQVAVRLDIIDKEFKLTNKMKIINIPYMTALPSHDAEEEEPFVYIHPSSVLTDSGEAPEYLVYQSLNKSSAAKLKLKPLNDISSKALANVGKHTGLISYSKPLGHPYGPKMLSTNERECYVVAQYGAVLREGTGGWSLGAQKVIQKKIAGTWEVV